MMCNMTGDWARLGALLKDARKACGLQQQDIANAIGVGRGAVGNIEKGDISRLTNTIKEYARVVGWTDDSPQRVLAGGEPELREPAADTDARAVQNTAGGRGLPDDLSVKIQAALSEGPLVDSQTLAIPVAGGRLTATIVVRGAEDATPEQLREQLLELRDKEWELRPRDE